MQKKPMVLILAGGVGNRFAPLTINKTMFPFLGKPLLQHILEILDEAGFENILVAANSENKEWLDSQKIGGLRIKTKLQEEALGMADAVLHFEKELSGSPFLVINPNDILESSLYKNILKKTEKSDGLVVGIKTENYFPGGYLKIENDKVVSVIEKPGEGNEPSHFVKPVLDYFADSSLFLNYLKTSKSKNDDVYEVALSKYMQEKFVEFVPYTGYWKALKYNFHVLDVMDVFLENRLKKHISKTAKIAENVVIDGEVYIDDGARVFEGSVIRGPVYIGKNAIVGNNCLIRNSVIEEGVNTGFGSEIARSYIGPKCQLHHNFIGDSVLESDVNPSYGTCTANLRFDGGNVKTFVKREKIDTGRDKFGVIVAKGVFSGVNCTFLPGTVIGANTKIFPGCVVGGVVPEDSVIKE